MTDKEFVLSPSSLNLFLKEPALWVMKHFYGIRGGSNIYAIRGKLVEKCVNILIEADITLEDYIEECTKDAKQGIRLSCIKEKSWSIEGIMVTEKDLEEFYKWGVHAFLNLPDMKSIVSRQDYVSTEYLGITLGGYIDYFCKPTNTGTPPFNLDLKTCNKLPVIVSKGDRKGMLSKTKADNVRQQIVYSLATSINSDLLYVTPTESLRYRITQRDIDEVMPSIQEGIKKIKYLLTLNIKDVIIDVEPGKMNSFYWDDELRIHARRIWNINN